MSAKGPAGKGVSAKATKKSAFSCEPCRRRKVKCGGEQPVCQRCSTRNDECVYKLNPTLSYTQRLEERIKDLEEQLASVAKSSTPVAGSSHSSPSIFGAQDSQAQGRQQTDDHMTRSFRGLKIDDNGGITYHGATSFFHLPNDRTNANVDVSSSGELDIQRRERLVSNAWQQRALENLSDIPQPFKHLLQVHWCWVQPLFNFIYRPAFTRDMQSLGPYYSHTLLNAILSHSIRWGKSDLSTRHILDESYDGGAVFGKHARSMLFNELSQGICSIPTLQTLLLLSAQECSFGNTTQAWTYSGLAFRLMDHLGICLDGRRYPGSLKLSDEDIEIRHRVFWSCYFWDKIISLYLGRSPALQRSSVTPPQIMFDDSAENELWIPFGAPQHSTGWKYPPSTAHSASCFMSTCRLSIIFNEISIHMYDPLLLNTEAEIQECFNSQEPELQKWWDQLPAYLKIEPLALPAFAPPSHIVTMNCLYHTFKILLYRPMLTRGGKPEDESPYSVKTYLVHCVTAATSIIAIFDLFCRTFSMNYCVLSLAYSVYIAASIFLLQVQAAPDDEQALRRLDYCIKSLEQVKIMSPVIGNPLSLIMKELSALGLTSAPPSQTPSDVPLSSPAFQPTEASHQMSPPTHPIFQLSAPNSTNAEYMPMNPGVFEAMSSLEPLSVRVGAIHGAESHAPHAPHAPPGPHSARG